MKKQSPHIRKHALQLRCAEHKSRLEAQAKAEQSLRAQILADVASLTLNASVHAWTGDNAQKMINLSGRLVYIVAFAANQAGFDAEHVDMRILRGMAGALADFAADQRHVERYRPSLQSGLAAINRLLPHCDQMALLLGAAALDSKLNQTRGLGTADVEEALGVAA
jgi:hypothetical protein